MLKRILVLSVTVGNGHMRAAEALKMSAAIHYPGIEVDILDTFRYASPILEKVMLGTYLEVLKMSPAIYEYLYQQSERNNSLSGWGKKEFNRIVNLLVASKLVRYIQEFQPDAIVCTHPFPVGVMSYMKRKGYFGGPVFVTITDFTIHSFWIFPEIDCYLIGDEALRQECDAFSLLPKQVQPSGIPIDPAFAGKYDRCELKAELGLHPELPVLLLTGGGLGMGHLESSVRMLGESVENCQLLVVAGANKSLCETLTKLAPEMFCPVHIYGYVNNMHQFMAVSDLLIGKPGGLSCAEAMAMGLPVLIVDPLPGQEERNTQFITSMGAGLRVSRRDLAAVVSEYLADIERLESMTRAAVALGKPYAARDALRLMLG